MRQSPDLVAARLMLADCLLQLRNREGAVEQLSAAVRMSPNAIQPVLQLATLLQSMKDFERAKPLLEQAERILAASPLETVAPGAADSPQPVVAAAQVPTRSAQEEQRADDAALAWRNLASLYLTRGDTDHALTILRRLEHSRPAEGRNDVARVLANRGELTDEARCELLARPTLESIEIVASSYARQSKPDAAEQTLKLLDQIQAKPGEKDLVCANIYQRLGKLPKAIEHARLAVAAIPENPAVWRLLVSLQLLNGAGEQAVATARDAFKRFRDKQSFKAVVDNEETIRAISDAAIARPLMATIVDDGADTDAIASALGTIQRARAANKYTRDVANELRPLADRAVSVSALQNLVIDLYLRVRAFDDATSIASRWMQTSPTDPNPARRTCEALASAGRWSEVIPVAQQWRTRLGASPQAADTMLAMAYIATGKPDDARKQLEPYLEAATRAPAQNIDVLGLYARALVAMNRVGDARAFLGPMLSIDPAPRLVWTQIAVQLITDADTVGQWLDQVDPHVAGALSDERFAMATARLQAARRLDSPVLRASALSAVQKIHEAIEQSAPTDAKLRLALGVLQEMQGDDAAAEASYRQSLKLGSKDPVVANNLAMVVVRRNGDLAEATQLAEQAAKDVENQNRHEFLDTLALIQSKSGKHEDALKSIAEAIKLQPLNPSVRARRVEILLAASKPDDAQEAVEEFERIVTSQRPPDPAMTAKVESLRSDVRAALDKK